MVGNHGPIGDSWPIAFLGDVLQMRLLDPAAGSSVLSCTAFMRVSACPLLPGKSRKAVFATLPYQENFLETDPNNLCECKRRNSCACHQLPFSERSATVW